MAPVGNPEFGVIAPAIPTPGSTEGLTLAFTGARVRPFFLGLDTDQFHTPSEAHGFPDGAVRLVIHPVHCLAGRSGWRPPPTVRDVGRLTKPRENSTYLSNV